MATQRKSSREKTAAYRARKRAQGMRLVQFWVPDMRTEEFRKEAHRQSLLAAQSKHAADDQAFIDAISDFWDE